MNETEVGRLLQRVAGRLRLTDLAGRCHFFVLVLAGAYLAVLLASRLLAVIPGDVFQTRTLLIIPVAAVLIALVLTRRRPAAVAARQVDLRMDTKDLFLTASMLETAPGEYQPLVLRDALDKARSIRPATVVPFDPWAKVSHVAVAMLVLLLAVLVEFQFDPFGKEEARQLAVERKERLREHKSATQAKAEELKKKPLSDENSARVAMALDALRQDLRLMKPEEKAGNLKRLEPHKADIGRMWKDLRQRKLADALKSKSTADRFGALETADMRKWKKELAAGSTAGMQQELSELQALAKKMSESSEGPGKEALKKELDNRLGELADFAAKQGTSPSLNEALSRAMQQLDMASMQGLSQEAMQGLQESLDLSMMEMGDLSQMMRDFESLSKALDAMRSAQALNNMGALDGSGAGELGGMSEYADLYAQMLADGLAGQGQMPGGEGTGGNRPGAGGGRGGGMGGPGQGRGGLAPEDDTIQTASKSEKERTKLTAGKILMRIKTKDQAEAGEVRVDLATVLGDLKHGVSEAIVQEEIPPGMRDAIKRYFDTIDQTVDTSGRN